MPEFSTIEPLVHMSMGAAAEMTSASVWMPVDIVAQKLAVQGPLKPPRFTGTLSMCNSDASIR